jgi:hypothetical protein
VGATWGSNLTSQPSDNDILNSSLDVDYSGTTIRIKKGSTVINSVGAPNALKNAEVTATDIGGAGYTLPASGATVGATWGSNLTSQPSDANILNSGTITGTIGSGGLSAANVATRAGKISNAGAFSGSLNATQFPMASMVTAANAAAVKTTIALNNVTNDAQIKTDGSNAPNALKNNQVTLTASGGTVTLNNAGSGSITKASIALNNVANETRATILGGNFTGAITGAVSVNTKMTIDYTNERILVED